MPCNEKFRTMKWTEDEKQTAIYAIALHSCGRKCAAFIERIRKAERYNSDMEEIDDESKELVDDDLY